MSQNILPKGNHLPSVEQLSALAKGRVPPNTVANTEKCRYLQNVKPDWRYNLHNKVDFPDLYARFDGLLKDMKKKSIGETKSTDGLSTDEIRHIIQHETLNPNVPLVDTPDGIIFRKGQQKNDQGGIDGNQFDLNIPFPPDPTGIAAEMLMVFVILAYINFIAIAQGKWYVDKQLADRTIRSMFKNICVECEIDIKGRNICNHPGRKTSIFELFDLGIPENTERHFLELLTDLMDFLSLPSSNTTIKRKNSINESDFSQSTSISESDSDFDVDESQEDSISNVSSFCTAKEIMEKGSCINSASHAPEEDHIIMKKRKDYNTV
ncbi:hypothetical protein RclHR1_06770012 [Rhizophagus clarus]|uniref:Uncharacterized protein n=1 Tax=Rhizophagus clarus TaxID=94130 RepID=A0A2Z6SJT7_9GLOM|nr:hypothetical protein RclHR1_06770012 [Rhizophagus clarus]